MLSSDEPKSLSQPPRRGSLSATRRRLLAAVLILAAALVATVTVPIARFAPLPLSGEPIDDGLARASGVVHVHTTLSDGGGTPEDVIAAARASGLDFVVITDHNNLDALPYEGYHEGELVLVGSELSTTAGHVLGLGLERDPVFRFSGDGLDGLLDIRDLGGFPVAAHPLSPREDLRWTDWDLSGPWGLEVINGDSAWRSAGARLLTTMALYQLSSRYALLRTLPAPEASLARWDELLQERDVPAIYGTDAHASLPITDSWALAFPTYEALFTIARNHLLLDEPLSGEAERDRRAVVDAFARGRSYLGLDALAPADGFSFVVESPEGKRWTMGDSLVHAEGLRARAGGRLPRGTRLRLIRNGTLAADSVEALDVPVTEPGVYRVEAVIEGWAVPWILSNAIAIFDRETLEKRRLAAAWPSLPATVQPSEILDDFDDGTIFESGHDTESVMEEPWVDPDGGVEGGALRLAFRLGEPSPEHPDVFVAFVSWEHRDLTGREGMTFWIRGDGVYRIWLQVRDANPASADDATEWWFASVKTAPEWRQVSVPFSRLRSINPRTDGRLDLDAVRAIVFVMDKGAMTPGSRGTIWLDDFGLY